MPMNRASLPKDLEEGLNTHFGMEYADHPEEWRQIYQVEGSNKAQEEDVQMVGFGAAQVKPEGGDYAEDEGGQGWSAVYFHDTIGLSFEITEEAIEDNLYYSLGPKYARSLARGLRHTKEINGAAVLNNATDGTNYPGGDGVALLSTAHPLWGGGTFSNTLATAADFSEAAVEDLLIQIRKAKDDRSVPISLRAVKPILPPELEYIATRVLQSPLRPGTADNDVNAIRAKNVFSSDPAIITRLTDADQWFLKTDCPDGLKHFKRKGVTRGVEQDPKTGNWLYTARERYSQGFTDPRTAYGSEGSG